LISEWDNFLERAVGKICVINLVFIAILIKPPDTFRLINVQAFMHNRFKQVFATRSI